MRKRQTVRQQEAPRYDIVYSREVESPHVKWADPYAKGPIRAFVVSSVHEGRTVVELMQRMSLDARAVSIDPAWDVNKWCIDRYRDFDDLVPRDYSKSYRVLEEELRAKTRYDVLVMHSMLGWNDIPAKIRRMIYARVKRGEGLVLVHPQLGENQKDKDLWQVSPLVGVAPTLLKAPGAGIDDGYPRAPKEAMSGAPWQKAADHFIVNGVPLEALPYPALQHYMYRLGKGAQALATGEGGAPVVAVKEHGKGRVVGLAYHNYALFPELKARRGELNENFWEYLFSLLMRSIVWAAGKEPTVRLAGVEPSAKRFGAEGAAGRAVRLRLSNRGGPKRASVSVTFRDEERNVEGEVKQRVRLGRGKSEVEVPLPGGKAASGRHFAEVMVSAGGEKLDWGTGTYEVRRTARVTKVAPEAKAVAAGGTLTGRARLAGKPRGMTLVSQLWDQSGRLLYEQESAVGSKREVRFRLKCPEALTNIGWVKCRLMDGGRLVDEGRAEVALTARRRKWEDYEVILPWLHHGVWPWTGVVEDQYREVGVTSTSDAQLNFLVTVSMHTPGFGIYWYRRHRYLERRVKYGKTGDTKYLERIPCFHTDEFKKPVAQGLRKGIPPILKYSPLAYYIADESSVTCYEDAFDLCWSEATLAEFRKWVRRQYRELGKLNREWGTRYRGWGKVMPVTWEEAQERGNPAPWVDHRLFMNRTLADAFRYSRDMARRVDPEGLVTVSGTQLPGSHNGCDWWKMDQIIQYLQPYDGGGQLQMHRSFNPEMILTGFTGYSLFGAPLEHQVWHRFFQGHRGASIFWGYSFVDPDLTLNAQGRALGKCFGELRGEGLCRTVAGLKREHDKIAVHYSMASGHVWWIKDGKLRYRPGQLEYGRRSSRSFNRFIASREGWTQALDDIGYQCNYVSYEQIEKGELRKGSFRLLVLPGSIALSEKEAREIRAFVKGGGTVVADVKPGQTDEHGKAYEKAALDDVFGAGRLGRGRALLVKQWFDEYRKVRAGAGGKALRALVREALGQAKVKPRAVVTGEGGAHPVGVERVSWRGGRVELVGLLREPQGSYRTLKDGTQEFVLAKGARAKERVRVELPREGHWYDVRAHRYLGVRSEIRTGLAGAEPKLYAMLPYEVRGLRLSGSGGRRRGEAVRYEVKLSAGSARPVRHVVKVEVFGPDGRKRHWYSRNVETRNGSGGGEFRLALNDGRGKWRMVATDVFSGATAEKTWTVR